MEAQRSITGGYFASSMSQHPDREEDLVRAAVRNDPALIRHLMLLEPFGRGFHVVDRESDVVSRQLICSGGGVKGSSIR